MEAPSSSEYRRQVERAQQRAEKDNRPWDAEGAGEQREHYSTESFPGLFEGRDLDSHFRKKQEEFHRGGQKFIVLDLASSPNSFISRLENIDGGVCVGFRDRRNLLERIRDRDKAIRMIKGDLLDQRMWREVDQAVEEFDITGTGFGAITLVPIGAGDPDSMAVYFQRVLRPAWKRLSFNNGEMFVDVNYRFFKSQEEEMRRWFKLLKESGIDFVTRPSGYTYRSFSFRLDKNKQSPQKLPSKVMI